MKLLDGKLVAEKIKADIALEVKTTMLDKGLPTPHLAAILVGEDPASQTYVASKEKDCKEVGFISSVYRYPANVTQEKLLEAIHFLNNDPEVDGFIVQLPLPKHIDENRIIEAIRPEKDVDGFHPVNVGRMVQNIPSYLPATPYGIVTLLETYQVETQGKHCVVLGRSNIVGTPVSILLSRKSKTGNATVTLCNSYTQNMKEIAASADILIVAMGRKESVTADMVKKDAVVVDVGIHRVEDSTAKSGFRLVGDVDFKNVSKKCSLITPVPGGIGPMTRVSLLLNTLKAAKKEFSF
jgi:methylenetetrahydrofolate dehydrogenase (NADP+) / methenyltetrahydrofolate cyclohydrolase